MNSDINIEKIINTINDRFKKGVIHPNFPIWLNDLQVSMRNPSRRQQIKELSNAYKSGKLVLVLGAGVSEEYGLPDWNILLQKLLINTFITSATTEEKALLAYLFTEVFHLDQLMAARYLQKYFQDRGISFENAVRDALYEKPYLEKEDGLEKEKETLNEIRELCASTGKNPPLDSIITYNFDDVLENHLLSANVKIRYKSIYCAGMNTDDEELPIYHVHGFLPQKRKLEKEHKIMLSEDRYHQQYSEIYNWSNIIQINKFKDNTCLFIGTSLTDPNQRRLLDIAKSLRGKLDKGHYHYIIRKKQDLQEVKEKLQKVLEQNKKLKNLIKDVDNAAEVLASLKENFEEEDAASFGISTIWVENYEEIPKILRQIRRQ